MENLGLSREQILEKLAPSSAMGDKDIHDGFSRFSSFGRLTLEQTKALITLANRDGPVRPREVVSLGDIRDFKGIQPDVVTYLNSYVAAADALMSTTAFSAGVPLKPATPGSLALVRTALTDGARLPVQFTFPKKRNHLYLASALSLIAALVARADILVFRLDTGAKHSRGGYIPLADCFYITDSASIPKHTMMSTIIHEGIHAFQDLFLYNGNASYTEVAAHLVQAVWLTKRKFPLHGRLIRPAFKDLAEEIVEATSSGQTLLFPINEERYDAMQAVLSTEPSYRKSVRGAHKDGIGLGQNAFRHPAPPR